MRTEINKKEMKEKFQRWIKLKTGSLRRKTKSITH